MQKVNDLLSKTKNHEVNLRDPKYGARIQDCNKTVVKTREEALQCLLIGSSKRRTGETGMNNNSSRSHAVFTITIIQVFFTKID
jgi:hypothetical protein